MKKGLFFIYFFILIQSSFSQTQFHFRYGSPFHDYPKKVIETHDGNYVVVGYTEGFGSAGNAFMLKVDRMGSIIWCKDYAGINRDVAWDVVELSDSSLVICGSTESLGIGYGDGFLMKTDEVGNLLWLKTYGNLFTEEFYHLCKDGTNGFYVAGYAQDSTSKEGTALLKLDSDGNIIWSKWVFAWSHQGEWWPIDMVRLSSGDVMLSGYGNTFSCWKFSSGGNLLWSNSYKCSGMGSSGLAIAESTDGSIFLNSIMGDTLTVARSIDLGIIKLDVGGNILWAKSYGGTYVDWDRTISSTKDTGLIICGNTNSKGHGDYDACLIKIKQDGSLDWAKAYGTVWFERPSDVIQTNDGGYSFCGQTWSIGIQTDSSKIHLVKTDSLGNSTCNDISWTPIIANHFVTTNAALTPRDFTFQVPNGTNVPVWPVTDRVFYQKDICIHTSSEEMYDNSQPIIFPNPFFNQLTVKLANYKQAQLILYDIFSQQVLQQTITNASTINTDRFAAGIYFYELRNDEGLVENGKIIKQ